MLLPVKKNLLVYKGTRFKQVINASVKNCSTRQKEPVDLSQYRAFMKVMKKECGCEKEVLFDLNDPETYIEVTDGVAGEITIDIPPAVTHAFDFSCGDYWIIMQHKTSADNYVLMHGEFSTVCTFLTEPDPVSPIINVVLVTEVVDGSLTRSLYTIDDSVALADTCDGTTYVGNGAIVSPSIGNAGEFNFQLLADPNSSPVLITTDGAVYRTRWFPSSVLNNDNGGWVGIAATDGVGGIDVEVFLIDDAGNGLEKSTIQTFRISDVELSSHFFASIDADISNDGMFGFIQFASSGDETTFTNLYIFAMEEEVGNHVGRTLPLGFTTPDEAYDTNREQAIWIDRSVSPETSIVVMSGLNDDENLMQTDLFFTALSVSLESDEVGYFIELRPVGFMETGSRPFGTRMHKVSTTDENIDKVAFTIYDSLQVDSESGVLMFDFTNASFVTEQSGATNIGMHGFSFPPDSIQNARCGWDWTNENILIPGQSTGLISYDPMTGASTTYTALNGVSFENDQYRDVQAFTLDISAGLTPFSCFLPLIN